MKHLRPHPNHSGLLGPSRWWRWMMLGLLGMPVGWLRAQPIVEGGSPYYVIAVRDALQGLRKTAPVSPQVAQNPQGANAAAGAVTPAGAGAGRTNSLRRWTPTPEFLARYYFCTNCQAWHLRPTPLTTLQQRLASNAAPSMMLSTTNPVPGTNRTGLPRPRPGDNPAVPAAATRTNAVASPRSP